MENNSNKINRKKILINIIAVIILLIVVIGVSIAGGYYSYTSGTANTIESGADVSLTYLESTSEIDLTNALPISDNKGKLLSNEGETFEFAVTTTSGVTQTIGYDINIEPLVVDTGLTSLDPEDIKVYLTDKEGNQLIAPTKLSDLNNFKLYSTKHNHQTANDKVTKKYVLKAWIDQNVEATNWYQEYKDNNKKYQYKFRVNINGSALGGGSLSKCYRRINI